MTGAVVLGLFAIVLAIFIVGAFFKLPGIGQGPGASLVNSYGLLSFVIPIYLFFASLTLADSTYHPSRIFLICSVIFPLITFTVGYAFIRNFEVWADKFLLFALLKKTGFSLVVVLITIFEVIVILAIRDLLFIPHKEQKPRASASFLDYQEPLKLPRKKPLKIVPFSLSKQMIHHDWNKTALLKNIDEDDPEIGSLLEDLNLPKQKPLASTRAFRQFEARLNKQNNDGDAVEQTAPPAPAEEDLLQELPKGCLIPFDGLLRHPQKDRYWIIDEAARETGALLIKTLEDCDVQAELGAIYRGPVITMFEILPAPGIKLSHIVKSQAMLADAVGASSIRITVLDPERNRVGLEIPNKKRHLVALREVLESETQREEKPVLSLILGKDVYNETCVVDLAFIRHCLIAGVKESGKSVFINTFILTILYQYQPEYCQLLLIDSPHGSLTLYDDIPHLFAPVITESDDIPDVLQFCRAEMKQRYARLDTAGVPDIHRYHQRQKDSMPFLVVIINECADILGCSELRAFLISIAVMGPAVGIHLILTTTHARQELITDDLAVHIPGRIAFMTEDKNESRLLIEISGAESLLGKGDMLYLGIDEPFPIRIQAPFVLEREVKQVIEYLKTHTPQAPAD
jgi:S-DNA-T family DNA segregation ATPase FtsK/SpoIIIE